MGKTRGNQSPKKAKRCQLTGQDSLRSQADGAWQLLQLGVAGQLTRKDEGFVLVHSDSSLARGFCTCGNNHGSSIWALEKPWVTMFLDKQVVFHFDDYFGGLRAGG